MRRLVIALLTLSIGCGRRNTPRSPAPVAPVAACEAPADVVPTGWSLPTRPRICDLADQILLVDDTCGHLSAQLWQGHDAAPAQLDGDVDRGASTGDRRVYRFPAVQPVTLDFAGRASSATLQVGGDREDCVAFASPGIH